MAFLIHESENYSSCRYVDDDLYNEIYNKAIDDLLTECDKYTFSVPTKSFYPLYAITTNDLEEVADKLRRKNTVVESFNKLLKEYLEKKVE